MRSSAAALPLDEAEADEEPAPDAAAAAAAAAALRGEATAKTTGPNRGCAPPAQAVVAMVVLAVAMALAAGCAGDAH